MPKKKKSNVKEIDGVLWLLDDNGNKIKKVKKKTKPGENDNDAIGAKSSHSGSKKGKKKKPNIKEIDGSLYLVDDDGNAIKKVRKKGSGKSPSRRRAASMGPIPGRRRARERIETGDKRLRSNSTGRTKQKPGSYIDAKGRKVVIDDDGNKTVYDKKGRKLRPKRKPATISDSMHSLPAKLSLHGIGNKPADYDRRADLLKSSIYESGRFDYLWSDSPKKERSFRGSQLGALNEGAMTNGENGRSPMPADVSKFLLGGENGASGSVETLSKQVTQYGEENRALKTQLMELEEKVRTLTQQNHKEKSKNVRATTEMLQLKADFQQASDEKRNLDLQVKNLEARFREKEQEVEKLESMPANRRITMTTNANGKSDHLVTQINDLMAENDALLDKLDLAKAASGHDVKKKEEQILYLNAELNKLREENDMLFRGEAEKDPLMGRLLKQKKDIEAKLAQEREKSSIRIDSMQETIETLEKSNANLKKELEKVTLQINDDDDDEVRRAKEMAQAVANRGTGGNARQVKRATQRATMGGPQRGVQRRGSGFWGMRDQ